MTPINDPTNDRYNPPGVNSPDFERYTFGELEVDELFWQSNKPGDGFSWRKINQVRFSLLGQILHPTCPLLLVA